MEIITSRKNPLTVHFKKLGMDTEYRRESGLYLCQGEKLYEEAVQSGADIREVMYCGEKPAVTASTATYRAAREILEYISPMQSAPDLLFSCVMPKAVAKPDKGRIIILENIQDPGNVGTVMRTAAAFGFNSLMLAGSCADPFNPKTVRASMGAVFKTEICQCDVTDLKKLTVPVYAAALSPSAVDVKSFRFSESFALAIGNEGHGLSGELLGMAVHKLKIPMEAGNESLNAAVAAAVLMWEAYCSKSD